MTNQMLYHWVMFFWGFVYFATMFGYVKTDKRPIRPPWAALLVLAATALALMSLFLPWRG